jgi:hypothetical protein
MRAFALAILTYVLTMMLAASTPVGASSGVHAHDLLHLAVPHAHRVGEHWVQHGVAASTDGEVAQQFPGPAVGYGPHTGIAGVTAIALIGLTFALAIMAGVLSRPIRRHAGRPRGRIEAPPLPPPQLLRLNELAA